MQSPDPVKQSENSAKPAGWPGGLRLSFEFFPPSTPKMEADLQQIVTELAEFEPDFVSVTYGAGGSARQRTKDTIVRIQNQADLRVAAHLTCIGASREEVNQVAQDYWQQGIRHIVALRGDLPQPHNGQQSGNNTSAYHQGFHPGGYRYAAELVSGLRCELPECEISVAAYPETHPEASSASNDLMYLRHKIEAGAGRAITQFFFHNDSYLRFCEVAQAVGIKVPIVPGILPVSNLDRTVNFARRCGANLPEQLVERFRGLEHQPQQRQRLGVELAVTQCQELYEQGIRHFHLYTLNRRELTLAVTRGLIDLAGVLPPSARQHGSMKCRRSEDRDLSALTQSIPSG